MSFMQTDLSVFTGNILTLRLVLSDPFALADSFSWNSSNPSVATVTPDSLSSAELQFLSPGTVTVTATNGVLSCSYTFSVQAPTVLIPGQTYYITNPTEGGYDLSFTPTTSGKYMIYTDQQIPIGITPADYNTEQHFFNGCQGIANTLRAGKQYTYTVYVPAWLNVAQLQVKIELQEAVSGFPSDDTPKATATPEPVPTPTPTPGPSEIFLSPEQFYMVPYQANEHKYAGTFLIEETGMYYLNIKAPHPEPWELFCEGNVVPAEKVSFEDSDTEAEYVYTLFKDKKYELVCDTNTANEAEIILSRTSILESDDEPMAYEPPKDKQNKETVVTNEAGLMERVEQENEGSTIHVCPEQMDNNVTLGRDAFSLAAERKMTIVIDLATGQLTFDVKTQKALSQISEAANITIEMNYLTENELKDPQKKLLNEYQVLYVPVNGLADSEEPELLPCSYGTDYIEFQTGHFSEFAVVEIPQESIYDTPEAPIPGDSDTSTRKPYLAFGCIALILFIGVTASLLIFRKHKKGK